MKAAQAAVSTTRRPIRAREIPAVRAVAGWLARTGVRPNQISVLSVLFAALGGTCLILSAGAAGGRRIALLLAAALLIQLRLLANLLDGLVAIEGGLRTPSGELFNEFPDRVSDALILVSAGHSATAVGWGAELGWMAGALALLTAYVRALGGSLGTRQHFCGPMAKPQRMAATTLACLGAALETALGRTLYVMPAALTIICVGAAVTVVRRIVAIADDLEEAGRC